MLITHDLGVVARVADRVQVMYAGRAVERGDVDTICSQPDAPVHPRPAARSRARPERLVPIPGSPPNMLRPPSGCAFRPRCPYADRDCAVSMPELRPFGRAETACIRAEELLLAASGMSDSPSTRRRRARHYAVLEVTDLVKTFQVRRAQGVRVDQAIVQAVSDVSLHVDGGETLGLVGESGSGKTTVGRCLLRLIEPTVGSIKFEGRELTLVSQGACGRCAEMQIVFQDPYASLDPRLTVGAAIAEPLQVQKIEGDHDEPSRRAARARRARPRPRPPLPARVLGRPAPAHRHRPSARARPEADRARRAGVGARRQHPGRCRQPARRICRTARPDLPVHRPRPVGGAPHLRRVAVMYLGKLVEIGPAEEIYTSPPIRTRRRCCRRCPSPTRRSSASASGSCSRATCRPRSTRRRAAGSAPAARRPRRLRRGGAAADRPRRRTPGGLPLRRGGHSWRRRVRSRVTGRLVTVRDFVL